MYPSAQRSTARKGLWNTHNPFRAVLLCADGYMVIWDYKVSLFLAKFNPLVRERRTGASLFYFTAGDNEEKRAENFANEVKDLINEHVATTEDWRWIKLLFRGCEPWRGWGWKS